MIFAKNFARNYEKMIILETSDAWSMSRLSQQTSEPAYYIVDCRILCWIIFQFSVAVSFWNAMWDLMIVSMSEKTTLSSWCDKMNWRLAFWGAFRYNFHGNPKFSISISSIPFSIQFVLVKFKKQKLLANS